MTIKELNVLLEQTLTSFKFFHSGPYYLIALDKTLRLVSARYEPVIGRKIIKLTKGEIERGLFSFQWDHVISVCLKLIEEGQL